MFDENDPSRRTWFVLHVKPRTEKKVEAALVRNGLWHHLPLYRKERRVQRRKVVTELPLFPGYVFTRMNADERRTMLETNMIVRTIPIPFPRRTVNQLRQIARAARGAPHMRTAPIFTVGEKVRITSGPFRNVVGIIVRDAGKTSVALNVDILGQAALISIDPNDCEPIKVTCKGGGSAKTP